MNIGLTLLWALILFSVIYAAVRLAIAPLIPEKDEINRDALNFDLSSLRDLGILDNDELEEAIKLYDNTLVRKEEQIKYEKYAKIVNKLKDVNFFTDEVCVDKMNKLKKHFNID